MRDENPTDQHDEDKERETTESGSSDDVNTPFSPHKDDDSELGDTDQHSTA